MKKLYAHGPNRKGDWHSLLGHCEGVSERAGALAAKFGCRSLGQHIGLLQDAGKAGEEWQSNFKYCVKRAPRQRVGVGHKEAGALMALGSSPMPGANEMFVAISIICHHGNLLDIGRAKACLNKASKSLVVEAAIESAKEYLGEALLTLPPLEVPSHFTRECDTLLCRMLHSCGIDADYTDTANHSIGKVNPDKPHTIRILSKETFKRVREQCAQKALRGTRSPSGFFYHPQVGESVEKLTALGFALSHAKFQDKDRVFFITPHTTVLSQVAQSFRAFLKGSVLEDHSRRNPALDTVWQRRTSETWDAPVVTTTHVNFFETLFARHNPTLRKLHNVVNSVLVIEDIQMLPHHLIEATLKQLKLLVDHFGCSVLFTSEVQVKTPPAFERVQVRPKSICKREAAPLCQTKNLGLMTHTALIKHVQRFDQALVILNSTPDLDIVLDQAQSKDIFCLSGRQTEAHRLEVIAAVKGRLQANKRCLLIATQSAEMGPLFKFPQVFRAMAPLERLHLARRRTDPKGTFQVFDLEKGSLPWDGHYKLGTTLTRELLQTQSVRVVLTDPKVYSAYRLRCLDGLKEDSAGINKWERTLRFEHISESYSVIDKEGVRHLIERENPSTEEALIVGRVRDKILKKQNLTRQDKRDIQPYTVFCRQKGSRESTDKPGRTKHQGVLVWINYHPQRGLVDE